MTIARAVGSNDVGIRERALALHHVANDSLFAPNTDGVTFAVALDAVLAGGPYGDGLAYQYVYAFEIVCGVLGTRVDGSWCEGLGPRYLETQLDAELESVGCAFRFMDLLMRERQEFGLPVPGDVPFVTRISPLESGMIATQLAAVKLEYGEEQEVVDGWRSMCERAVEERQDLLSFYA